MKKWIYKLIFSIAIVPLVLFMLPKKEVKAQGQQGFPTYLLKADYIQVFHEASHANTEEFLVQYVVEGIVTDTINDYFFIFIHYNAMNKGLHRGRNSYGLEDIEPMPSFNATEIYVRFTFTRHFLNDKYGGYDCMNVLPLFAEDSAFYIAYDVYNWGYGDGFVDGRDFGRGMGYQEGYVDGHYEGYWEGYDAGKMDGYDEGYADGELDGYDDGYTKGYNKGLEHSYDVGYDDGYEDGKADGFEIGQIAGYNDGYAVGYSDGLSETTDKNFGRLLGGVFAGIGAFLGINLLPGISIGAIIAVPIIFGIIAFILGRKKD